MTNASQLFTEAALLTRLESVERSLHRHRLVFLHAGSLFEPLRHRLLDALRGSKTSVSDRATWAELRAEDAVIVTDLEQCVTSSDNVLGEVREVVLALLDEGAKVCLVSRAPRIAYRSVPGSSVLEDAALALLAPLRREELAISPEERAPRGWPLPCVTTASPLDQAKYGNALDELGQGLVSALDHALFEVDPKNQDGLGFLGARELEGLRGAGIVCLDANKVPRLTASSSAKVLREAISHHISHTTTASDTLSPVVTGLWAIERMLRAAVRTKAIEQYGAAWRLSCIGALKDEVLRRAQLDSSIGAKSVEDLRDPLEWLTMGELLELIRGEKFGQLGIEPVIWRKLQEQLLPIRNRLAHMRMLKADDHEIVQMWLSSLNARLKR
ncbi:hypothetical protein [Agrococcus lahaulensis]|uniref:hypothetical protein n=1 Tax=Agrococcus lahaulensis TaxID=341722 RepID=UPI0012EC0D87|nr:hypothetical protein [Agrococcus lahaulensis]